MVLSLFSLEKQSLSLRLLLYSLILFSITGSFTEQTFWLLKWQFCIRKNSLTHSIFTRLQITVRSAYPSPAHTHPFEEASEKFPLIASKIFMPWSYEYLWAIRKCSFLKTGLGFWVFCGFFSGFWCFGFFSELWRTFSTNWKFREKCS